MQKRKLELIHNRCGFNDGIYVDSNGHYCGITLWWNDMVVSLVSFSNQHILVEIKDDIMVVGSWFACGVYGWPERANKSQTWVLVREIRKAARGRLVMFGDFNEILCLNEKEGWAIRGKREMVLLEIVLMTMA